MPPPNTPNNPSDSSSPISISNFRHLPDLPRHSNHAAPSESLVTDLHTFLASTARPTRSNSGSATPSVSTTPTIVIETNYNANRSTTANVSPLRNATRSTLPHPSHSIAPLDVDGRATAVGIPLLPPEPHTPVSTVPPARTGQVYEPRIDWQDLEYIGQVDENLFCGICKTPFHKPTTSKACGHTFCEACLGQALEEARRRSRSHAPCPLCRTELGVGGERGTPRFVRVVELAAQLDRLQVKCSNDPRFCTWSGSRSNIEKHVKDHCDYTPFPCPSSSCDKIIIRKSRSDSCRHYYGSCAYCDGVIDVSTEHNHHMTVCPKYRVACLYCGDKFPRDLLARHGDICKSEETTCTYAKLGCSYLSPRSSVIEHEKTCDRGMAMKLVNALESRLRDELDQVKKSMKKEVDHQLYLEKQKMDIRLRELQEEEHRKRQEVVEILSRPEHLDFRHWRYRDLETGNTVLTDGNTDEASRLPSPVPVGSNHEQAEYYLSMFDELDKRVRNVSKALIDQDARHSMLLHSELMPLKEQLVEARSQLGVIGMHVRWLMDVQRSRQRQTSDVVSRLVVSSSSPGSSDDTQNSRPANSENSRVGSIVSENSPGISRRMSDRTSPVRPSL